MSSFERRETTTAVVVDDVATAAESTAASAASRLGTAAELDAVAARAGGRRLML